MSAEFQRIFIQLKAILQDYEESLNLKKDQEDEYYLNTANNPVTKTCDGYFGSVHIKKNYVSFYLMPVYVYPELLESISQPLKKRMQGKSCFNFKKIDKSLFEELQELTKKGFDKYRASGWLD
ncbi:hypothetical protein [Sutcliffiella deserti]|uniref:hypothetical protein n=1 Tax=Sutcliffiella deserti TaxID=2875501 RepID=UPI001CBBA593|nr:hypothetical protein [Sutcliffiella deserti]